MSAAILNDQAILEAIQSNAITLEVRSLAGGYTGFDIAEAAKFEKDGPVQPSSLDLTIGHIYKPPPFPSRESDQSADLEHSTGTSLEPGQTALIETREKISLGGRYGAFGFPPASVSRNSILMTNPGHVDPGYSGHLSFTIINMGRTPYNLKIGEVIVSLLVFDLGSLCAADYSQRRSGTTESSSIGKLLNRLAPDFAAFGQRMDIAASAAVDRKLDQFERLKILLPAAASVISAIVGGVCVVLVASSGNVSRDEFRKELDLSATISNIESRIDSVERRGDIVGLESRIQNLEELIENSGKQDSQ